MPNSRVAEVPALDPELEQRTIRRVIRRLVPFLVTLYLVNFLDRTNVGFAALQMNKEIGISPSVYGLGAGIFFFSYFLFEVPSNVLLHKFGARVWIARIMISWGLVATAMGFLQTPVHFIVLRVLLGIAEAGFFPGVIFLLSMWIPRRYCAGVISSFYLGIPISQVIGAPLSVGLMEIGSRLGFSGWRVMYVLEGLPALVLGIVCLFYLTDTPAQAQWLTPAERDWLTTRLAQEEKGKALAVGQQMSKRDQVRCALTNKLVWRLALIYFGITAGANTMNFFLPSVLDSFQGKFGIKVGLLQNGLITAIPYAVTAVAMYLWSCRSDRYQERRKHAGGAALFAAISITIALLINNPIVIVMGFTLLAAGDYAAINVFWAIPPRILTGLGAATGIGLINSIGNLSGFFGPYATGLVYSLTGSYTLSFLVIAAVVALGGIGVLLLPERYITGTPPAVPEQ
jgi:ACS family tartrate transporter-like MFS transporter